MVIDVSEKKTSVECRVGQKSNEPVQCACRKVVMATIVIMMVVVMVMVKTTTTVVTATEEDVSGAKAKARKAV